MPRAASKLSSAAQRRKIFRPIGTNGTRNSMAVIKLKYVNSFPNRDRKGGRVRYYFRRRGEKAIPLPGLPGSEECMAAYAMALAAIPDQREIGASKTLPGSINALVVDYYRSAEWQHGLRRIRAR